MTDFQTYKTQADLDALILERGELPATIVAGEITSPDDADEAMSAFVIVEVEGEQYRLAAYNSYATEVKPGEAARAAWHEGKASIGIQRPNPIYTLIEALFGSLDDARRTLSQEPINDDENVKSGEELNSYLRDSGPESLTVVSASGLGGIEGRPTMGASVLLEANDGTRYRVAAGPRWTSVAFEGEVVEASYSDDDTGQPDLRR